MLGKLFAFIARPIVGVQTTGNLAYQQSHGYALSDVNGNGGHGVARSFRATTPGGIVVGNTHKVNDPFVTGNIPGTVRLAALTDDAATKAMKAAQF